MTQTLPAKLKLSRDEKLEINLIAAAILSHQHVPEAREQSEKNFLQAGRQLPPHPRSSDMDTLHNLWLHHAKICIETVMNGDWKSAFNAANSALKYWIEIDGTKFTFQLEIVWAAGGQTLAIQTAINGITTIRMDGNQDSDWLKREEDLCRWIFEHDTGETRGRKLAGDDTAIFRENGSSLSLRDAIETNYPHLVQAFEAIRQTLKPI
jgi:hypothetical protein